MMEYPHLILVKIKDKNEKIETIGTLNPITYFFLLQALEYNKLIYFQRLESSLDFALIGISNDNSALRLEIEALQFKYGLLFILSRSLIIEEDGREYENTEELIKLIRYHPEIWKLYHYGRLISKPDREYRQ